MSDFGSRGGGVGATAAKQDEQEVSLDAIQAAGEALSKVTVVTPVNNQVFDNVQTTYTSAEINSAGYRKFLLRIILGVTLAPTDIKINVQFSQGGATFENYMRGPFGSLMYEDTAGAKSECIEGDIAGDRMKINVIATGTDASNKFTLTCKLNGSR